MSGLFQVTQASDSQRVATNYRQEPVPVSFLTFISGEAKTQSQRKVVELVLKKGKAVARRGKAVA